MNILFICHRLPYPPNRGGKIRPFNMVRHLSAKHTVVVGSLAHTVEELDQGAGLAAHCEEVIAEMLPNSTRWFQAGQALASARPSSVAYFRSALLHRRIADAARRFKFAAVIVHCAFAAQYALDVPAKFRLLDYGDLDSGKWSDYESFRAFPLCYGYGMEARKLRSYERQLAQRFDHCTVTTQGELEEFKRLNVKVPSSVIPNGVDADYFHTASTPKSQHVIVFVGRMDYFPNIDGAEYFARHIFPKIRQQFPDASLRLVGSDPTPAIRDLGSIAGVTVTGHVPDVRPYVLDATVAVAPLRLARGTQNKILEAMAMGIPIVSTSVAAKGVAAVPGEHLLIADDPNQFASQVIRVLESETLGKSLSAAARNQVQKAHCWPNSMGILDAILEGVFETDHPLDISRPDSKLAPSRAAANGAG